jgi:hypothetical protein
MQIMGTVVRIVFIYAHMETKPAGTYTVVEVMFLIA